MALCFGVSDRFCIVLCHLCWCRAAASTYWHCLGGQREWSDMDGPTHHHHRECSAEAKALLLLPKEEFQSNSGQIMIINYSVFHNRLHFYWKFPQFFINYTARHLGSYSQMVDLGIWLFWLLCWTFVWMPFSIFASLSNSLLSLPHPVSLVSQVAVL